MLPAADARAKTLEQAERCGSFLSTETRFRKTARGGSRFKATRRALRLEGERNKLLEPLGNGFMPATFRS